MLTVLDHGPHAWFLLSDGQAVFLEARCSHSIVDYSWLIELNEEERAKVLEHGHAYLDELAHAIHYSAPAAIGSNSPYKHRNLKDLADEATAAISAWMKTQPN